MVSRASKHLLNEQLRETQRHNTHSTAQRDRERDREGVCEGLGPCVVRFFNSLLGVHAAGQGVSCVSCDSLSVCLSPSVLSQWLIILCVVLHVVSLSRSL